MKSGNLDFLETSGPLQACNGTAVPLHRGVWRGNIEEEDHLEEGGVDGRMMLNWILNISLFHRAFFNSIMDKTPTHALFYSTLY